MLTEEEVLALFESCSNRGRWGEDDERGTANLITPAKRIAAAALVREGIVVPLGYPLEPVPLADGSLPVVRRMLYERHDPIAAVDALEVAPHGLSVTHVDAVGHVYFEGAMYNGRQASVEAATTGLRRGSVSALRQGIFTRAVLLDVAQVREVPWLEPGEIVTREDLERAEEATGTRVSEGDAVIVHIGIEAMARAGQPDRPELRAGLGVDCIPWLHERGVAVYGGDCIERLPSPYPRIPLPLHQVGLVAMGLVMLDNPRIDVLRETCRKLGRADALLVVAPLDVPGGTGSPVNALALF